MGENIANKMTSKLISKIYKLLIQLNIKNTNNPIKKWVEYLSRHFPKKDIQTAIKRCSTSLIIRGIQMKTTMRYHRTPIRMIIIKRNTNNKYWQGCGRKGNSVNCQWGCKLVQPLWKTVWMLLKKLKVELLCDPIIPLMDTYLKKEN